MKYNFPFYINQGARDGMGWNGPQKERCCPFKRRGLRVGEVQVQYWTRKTLIKRRSQALVPLHYPPPVHSLPSPLQLPPSIQPPNPLLQIIKSIINKDIRLKDMKARI